MRKTSILFLVIVIIFSLFSCTNAAFTSEKKYSSISTYDCEKWFHFTLKSKTGGSKTGIDISNYETIKQKLDYSISSISEKERPFMYTLECSSDKTFQIRIQQKQYTDQISYSIGTLFYKYPYSYYLFKVSSYKSAKIQVENFIDTIPENERPYSYKINKVDLDGEKEYIQIEFTF